jgi:hypothetical protein
MIRRKGWSTELTLLKVREDMSIRMAFQLLTGPGGDKTFASLFISEAVPLSV